VALRNCRSGRQQKNLSGKNKTGARGTELKREIDSLCHASRATIRKHHARAKEKPGDRGLDMNTSRLRAAYHKPKVKWTTHTISKTIFFIEINKDYN
jgi:hypothetical protein